MIICIRQLIWQLPSSSYNHNTPTALKTSVKESLQMHFKVAVGNFHVIRWRNQGCYEGIQCIVALRWTGKLSLGLPYAITLQHHAKWCSYNHCFFSLSATRITTWWLVVFAVYCFRCWVIWYSYFIPCLQLDDHFLVNLQCWWLPVGAQGVGD